MEFPNVLQHLKCNCSQASLLSFPLLHFILFCSKLPFAESKRQSPFNDLRGCNKCCDPNLSCRGKGLIPSTVASSIPIYLGNNPVKKSQHAAHVLTGCWSIICWPHSQRIISLKSHLTFRLFSQIFLFCLLIFPQQIFILRALANKHSTC